MADSWGKGQPAGMENRRRKKNADFFRFLKQSPPYAALCPMKADGHRIPKMKKIGKK
jgi:hypothetical protein